MERVVITGMGAITPVGNDVPSFWESLKTGKCGIGPITKFDVSDFKVKLGAEVKDFDPTQYMEKREARRADANVHYAMAAAIQAVEQAGLKEGNFDPYRTGVIFGSGVGGLHVAEQEVPKLLEKGSGRVSPFAIPEMIANIAAAYISMHFGFKGENFCPVSACATGNHSIGEAMRAIRHGYQDVVVCGGTENGIIPISMAGFQNMKAVHMGDDPTAASIPFWTHAVPALSWARRRLSRTREPDARTAARRDHSGRGGRLRCLRATLTTSPARLRTAMRLHTLSAAPLKMPV